MKSFSLLAAIFLTAAIANIQAADTPKPSPKASPSATPDKSGLPDTVAVVEGKKIKKAELETQLTTILSKYGQTADSLTPDELQKAYHHVLEQMIIDRLLKERAATVKVTDADLDNGVQQIIKDQFNGSKDDFTAALKEHNVTMDKVKEDIRPSVQLQKWIDSQVTDKVSVSDADAKSFYDKHPDQFVEPAMIRVSHILIMVPNNATPEVTAEKEKLAKAAKDRITKGEDFAKVAGEVSEDPQSKDKGGDLVEYFPKGSMTDTLPEFEDAAFKLKKGEVSDPVKTKLGWHIIKVTDIKDAKTDAYTDIKDKLIEALKDEKTKQAENDLFMSLLDKNAKIYLPPLPKTPVQTDQEQVPGDQGGPGPGMNGSGNDAPQPPTDQKAPPKELGAP